MYGGWTPILFFVNCLTFLLAKPMVMLAWIGSWRHNANSGIITKLIYDICNLLTVCIIVPVFAFFILSPFSHFWFGWTSTSFYKFPQGTLFRGIFNAIFSFGFLINFSDIISQMNFQLQYDPFTIRFLLADIARPVGRGAIFIISTISSGIVTVLSLLEL